MFRKYLYFNDGSFTQLGYVLDTNGETYEDTFRWGMLLGFSKVDLDGNTWEFTDYGEYKKLKVSKNSTVLFESNNIYNNYNVWGLDMKLDGTMCLVGINYGTEVSSFRASGAFNTQLGLSEFSINNYLTHSVFIGSYIEPAANVNSFGFVETRAKAESGVPWIWSGYTARSFVSINLFTPSQAQQYFPTSISDVPPPTDTDPFIPGGENEHGGGGGDFSDPSEDVTDPAVPDISAVDTGFITLFNPSISQLNSLASYMWSAGFDLETFKKMFANPMDCILGLSILPKIVPSGGSRTVMVGNISTGVSMTVAASQYVKFDCGSITVKRYSNSFLDYAPYTKVSIYLPFIGIHELSVDDVMNKSVHVKYNIDILSGACVAFVICGGTTLYTYTGQCAASVPVTSGDWSNMINGVIGAVGGALKAAVGGAVGGLVGAIGSGAASLASSAMDVAGMKPSIEHSGNMGGMGGMMGVKTPFLIITRPQQAIPAHQNKYTGYPAFVTKELNELEGYTELEEIHLENIPATEQELTEIYNLLKNGVIL